MIKLANVLVFELVTSELVIELAFLPVPTAFRSQIRLDRTRFARKEIQDSQSHQKQGPKDDTGGSSPVKITASVSPCSTFTTYQFSCADELFLLSCASICVSAFAKT